MVPIPNDNSARTIPTWEDDVHNKENDIPWFFHFWNSVNDTLCRFQLLNPTHIWLELEQNQWTNQIAAYLLRKNTQTQTNYTDILAALEERKGINMNVRRWYSSYSSKKDRRYFSSYLFIIIQSSGIPNTIINDKPSCNCSYKEVNGIQKQNFSSNTIIKPSSIGWMPENGIDASGDQFMSGIFFFSNNMSEIRSQFNFSWDTEDKTSGSHHKPNPKHNGMVLRSRS